MVLSGTIFTDVQAGTQDHFILTNLWTLAIARVDSIISPGKVSGHAHNLIGGSLVGRTPLSPGQLQTAACSSCIIGADKSNYWAAQLFWRYPDDTYEPLLNQNRIYYFLKGDTKPFPPGLRMITGLSQTRNASAVETTGVRISCNHELQTKYLPNGKTHPEGCTSISLGIYYPSCGLANGALDSPDHFSHMAWPISWNGSWVDDPNGVTCPSSHPIKYPTIFMENNYYLSGHQTWRSGDENILVLANGDTTGLAFHADYVYGWDQDVLIKTIEQCGHGHGPGEALTECAPLAASMSISNAWDCRLEGQIPDEGVLHILAPLHSLPGCNPLWTAEMPDVHPKCSNSPPDPPFVAPNVYFENLKYREHLPIAFTLANNASDLTNYTPSIGGGRGFSSLYWWADQVLSSGKKPKIQSSTTEQVIAGRGSGSSRECCQLDHNESQLIL
ncbi:hypothetical protein BCR39DRAFT_463805 [Naematelia encephala]|uniref:DUF1996 domain-containing protein n=1 Tax=Naematelia encephala TaxID=71784 RepID=A0A1Y2BEX1_9TREE|nr:hypothetical protein BCR39DRAFT_463805 [Naematelia encephala]